MITYLVATVELVQAGIENSGGVGSGAFSRCGSV